MDFIKKRLLEESVRFIELCQSYYLKGKIDENNYNTLTSINLRFIKDVLKEEEFCACLDLKLSQKLHSIFVIDNKINGSDRKVVCLKDCYV